ncbi:MAG: HlyD family efflux transporter periplasmic adaptor subunit [Maritimibacter sp.]|nr:HlyD family efflux transporter periplasmic adaptor subunit [Maritimibacter sp.]
MGSLARAGAGLAIGGAALAMVLAAGGITYRAWQDGPGAAVPARTPGERAYAVEVATLEPATAIPTISAYGRLESGRTLELRASLAGALVELGPSFRDGGVVAEGDLLYRIDPARLETALALAGTDLSEAEAALAEARAALELARLEARAANDQLALRDQALARQQGLRDRGVATEAELETATLARAAAEQTLINRQQVVAGDEARVDLAAITLERRRIAAADAARALDEASVTAPFAGVLAEVTAVEGRLVSANEQLAVLIDPTDIEVAFRVTSNQFARLLNDQGALRQTDMVVELQRGRQITELPAKLDRAGAEIAEDKVGRLVYARLTAPDATLVQPGDFVTVRIPERPLEGVATIPAAAATADGRILLLGEGGRLEEVQATLLRHQGDSLIVTDVPFGRQYVTARALQLGPGIQVTPVEPAPAAAETAAPAAATAENPAPAASAGDGDTIALDDARRAAIVAFIEASEKMKPEKRDQWLEELSRPEVPRATVEKFETMMAEGQ